MKDKGYNNKDDGSLDKINEVKGDAVDDVRSSPKGNVGEDSTLDYKNNAFEEGGSKAEYQPRFYENLVLGGLAAYLAKKISIPFEQASHFVTICQPNMSIIAYWRQEFVTGGSALSIRLHPHYSSTS